MSELRTNVFFRPWQILENGVTAIASVDSTQHDGNVRLYNGKQEDDNESVVSSTTSTSSSTISTTIAETSDKCDDRLLDRGMADSTSPQVARRARKQRQRGSESSYDDVATSTTPSFDDAESRDVQAATKRSRVSPRSRQSTGEGGSKTPRDAAEYGNNDSTNVCSLKHLSLNLQELSPRTSEDLDRTSWSSMAVADAGVAGPSSAHHRPMMSELYYDFSHFHPGIHPAGVYPVVQPPIHPAILPVGFYTRSMEEAVHLVHRQDVAAKQIKKMRPKKFRCQYCDVAFSNNGQLKGHVRIHTGERPFKCEVESCGKSFTRNEELTRHKRIHTGERNHVCVVCRKSFGRKDHLKKHTRTHEVRNPYHLSAAALDMLALGHHPFQQAAGLAPYVYQI